MAKSVDKNISEIAIKLNIKERMKMPSGELSTKRIIFWLLWMLATILGLILEFGVKKILGIPVSAWDALSVMALLTGAVTGFALGLFQYFVLRIHIENAFWWIVCSTLGVAFGNFIVRLILVDNGFTFYIASKIGRGGTVLTIAGVFGVVMGVIQWFAVRQWLQQSWIWVPAAVLGTAFGDYFAVMFFSGSRSVELPIFVSWLLTEMFLGLILVLLFRKHYFSME
jgi:hypothetical protein